MRWEGAIRPAIWIVSYPRSGNTFLRALLANYLSGLDRPLTLAELSWVTRGEHDETIWSHLTGRPVAERRLEEAWGARPAYFARLRALGEGARALVKSHTVNGALFGTPGFDFAPDDRVIHLVRHPCDVALSCADFYGVSVEDAVERLLTDNFMIDGRPNYGFEVLGSWRQHTWSWRAAGPAPILRVRYADLLADPGRVLSRALPFLGCAVDSERVAAAARYARFEELRRQEEAAGFAEASRTSASGRFFRRGCAMQWREELAPDLARRLLDAHADLLGALGFAGAAAPTTRAAEETPGFRTQP